MCTLDLAESDNNIQYYISYVYEWLHHNYHFDKCNNEGKCTKVLVSK